MRCACNTHKFIRKVWRLGS